MGKFIEFLKETLKEFKPVISNVDNSFVMSVQSDNLEGFTTKERGGEFLIFSATNNKHVATLTKDDGDFVLYSNMSSKDLKNKLNIK